MADDPMPEPSEYVSVFLLAVLIAFLFTFPLYLYQTGPPEFLIEEGVDAPGNGSELVFTQRQVTEFNDVYERREREWMWCMDVDGRNVSGLLHPASANTTISSVTAACQSEGGEGTVHTHPSGSGVLSDVDRVSSFRYTCLVHGSIPERSVVNPRELDCYLNLDGDDVRQIPVIIR